MFRFDADVHYVRREHLAMPVALRRIEGRLRERVVELCWFIMAGTPEMQSVPGEWEGESLCGKQECRTEQEKME